MALIRCENVTLAYEGRPVVHNLSFDVQKGDCLYVVGENGAGKSTLVKGLLGLLKPREGRIILGDGLKPFEIGYLPQQTALQKDFPASVNEVVLSGCLNSMGPRPFYGKKHKELARRSMERLGIPGIANECYRDLSGGQQRRVLLARALCAAEKLILLDEPAAGLDPIATAELYRVADELNAGGMTVIMVSHDMAAALDRSKHILHLCAGGHFFGTPEQYRTSELYRAFTGDAQ